MDMKELEKKLGADKVAQQEVKKLQVLNVKEQYDQ